MAYHTVNIGRIKNNVNVGPIKNNTVIYNIAKYYCNIQYTAN